MITATFSFRTILQTRLSPFAILLYSLRARLRKADRLII